MGKITLVVDSMSMIDKLDFKAIQKETGYAREDIDFITREEYKELQRKELADLKEYANENGERIVKEHLKEVSDSATEEFLKRYHEYLEYDSGFHKSHSSKSFRYVKHKSRNQKTRQKKANKKAKRNNH